MKFVVTFAALPLLLLSACSEPSTPSAQAQEDHEQHAPAATASQETPAQRYATDAPLRKGMA